MLLETYHVNLLAIVGSCTQRKYLGKLKITKYPSYQSNPGALLPLLPASPLPAATPLPPLAPLPCPCLPLLPCPLLGGCLPPPPVTGKVSPRFSPWSPWRPVRATSLVSGAWWNSFLEQGSLVGNNPPHAISTPLKCTHLPNYHYF